MRLTSQYDSFSLILTPRPEDLIMTMTHSEIDQKMDEHFGFEAQDNVEGVLATNFACFM